MTSAATSSDSKVPDHVPPELVWDHSFAAYLRELDDPYLAGARLQDGPGVIWATDAAFGKPAWIPIRHAYIKEGYADHEHFSNVRGRIVGAVMESDWLMLPVEADPPDHQEYRRLLHPFFTRGAVDRLEPQVQGLSDSLIDAFEARGSCEFVSEYAAVLPNAIVLLLLGMPQSMLQQFLQWEETAIRGATDAERLAAGHAIIDYLKGFIEEQRPDPQTGLMAALFSGRYQGRPLHDDEILGICYMLYVAGLDTVFSSLGWILRHLALHPDLQERLRANPHEIPAAVEEFSRAYGVSAPTRVVRKDFDFHGVPMRAGDDMILPTYLAGRDPRAYPNPHVIDVERKPREVVTFGFGAHLCLGIHLAKREMKICIESFLSRMKNIHIPEGEAVEWHTGGVLGLDRLPLAWDR